ncbi:lysozyme [Parasediminibacterium paludis]|uniref:Lysozyme n=2 Tax=Parasediminibacterium paludis TaxID=908966 RepID=A0ABV8PVJ4_9BACT
MAIIVTIVAIVVMFRRQLFPKTFNDEVDMLTDNFKAKIFNLISGFEGYASHAYHDKIDPPGVYTIGFGSIYNWDENRAVQQRDVINKDTAVRWFFIEANQKVSAVQSLVKVPINDNQLLALSSFAYNLGTGALQGSTLLRLLNQGISKQIVANEFDKWAYSNGKKIPGLVKRRSQEKALFLS